MVRQRFKWEIGGDIPFTLHNRIQYVFTANLNGTIRNHIRNHIHSLSLSLVLSIPLGGLVGLSCSLFSSSICFSHSNTIYQHRKINKQTQYINFITPLCSMPNQIPNIMLLSLSKSHSHSTYLENCRLENRPPWKEVSFVFTSLYFSLCLSFSLFAFSFFFRFKYHTHSDIILTCFHIVYICEFILMLWL